MSDTTVDKKQDTSQVTTPKVETGTKAVWQTPKLEDVSEQVMAQPYIRFT